MGRKILVVTFLLSILIVPSYIYAQEQSATTPGRMHLEEEKEAMTMKRKEFKERLQTIRDETKRMQVERIDTKISSANQTATNRFSAVLDKLQSILDKLIGKAQDVKAKGIGTTALDSAIGSAQASIDDAKAAVTSQMARLYVIQIASESALKSSVGSTVSELRTDLRDVHKAVVDAKQAVQKAVIERAKLRGPQ